MDVVERLIVPVIVVVIVLIAIASFVQSRRATKVPRCSRCGYDLSGQTGSSDAVCPECGSDLSH